MNGKENGPVIIQVAKEYIKLAEKLQAFVFDKQGEFVEKASFKEGQAVLKSTSDSFHSNASLFLAPPVPREMARRKITAGIMKKLTSYEPSIRINRDNIINIKYIPNLTPILFNICNITGNISKAFQIDGQAKVLPVCNVRVNICEVDPFYFILPYIPDKTIFDIRDKLLDIIVREKLPPIPYPLPDPPPYEVNPLTHLLKTPINKAVVQKKAEMQLYSLPLVDDEVLTGLSADSLEMVRNTLHNYYEQLRPYFCLFFHYWPFLYRCDPIATVYPDCNGRFEYPYFYFQTLDQPDIYIWVEANIDGVWQTVYAPGISCGTHWNYACGTDINISITDDRVKPCQCAPLPGQVVWVKRVNNGISIRNIQQNTNPSGHIGNAIGLTNHSGLFVSPFAMSFPFVVQFGSGFPSSNVRHYRWKYRRIKDADLNNVASSYLPYYDSLVSKAYTYERVNSDGDTVFYTGSFNLGPVFTSNGPVYKIPHVEASVDIPAEPTAEWDQDTYSISLNSQNMSDGLYEFILELVDNNGAIVPLDPDVFVVDKKSGELSNPPDANTITANGRPENYVLKNGAGKAIGFRFVMRIDNQPCYADIKDALIDGVATHSECGFGQYYDKNTSQVTLGFEASQPHDFGTYSFNVVKGNGNPAGPTNTSGYLTVANDGYSVTNNNFKKNVAAASMLGNCDQAAFAEHLYVRALHTNGNRQIWEYDRSDLAAFAIEPMNP